MPRSTAIPRSPTRAGATRAPASERRIRRKRAAIRGATRTLPARARDGRAAERCRRCAAVRRGCWQPMPRRQVRRAERKPAAGRVRAPRCCPPSAAPRLDALGPRSIARRRHGRGPRTAPSVLISDRLARVAGPRTGGARSSSPGVNWRTAHPRTRQLDRAVAVREGPWPWISRTITHCLRGPHRDGLLHAVPRASSPNTGPPEPRATIHEPLPPRCLLFRAPRSGAGRGAGRPRPRCAGP